MPKLKVFYDKSLHGSMLHMNFYVPAPYQNELAGLPNGRIRKNIEEKDRLKIAGLYSFGFNAEGKILCSQEAPDNIGNGIITDIYEYDNAFSYYVYHVKYIPNQYTTIISISYFYPYHEMNIFQGINSYKIGQCIYMNMIKKELVKYIGMLLVGAICQQRNIILPMKIIFYVQ